jgi:hypothetical protein
MDKLLEYAKAVVAAVGSVVTLVQAALADQAVSLDEAQGIWTAVLAAATVVAVLWTPNKPAASSSSVPPSSETPIIE